MVPRPVLGMSRQEKRNGSRLPGCIWPWSRASRPWPSRGSEGTPSRLKLPITSASTRSRRGRASLIPSAGRPKVMYLERSIPLFDRAICPLSMDTYSARMLLKSSWAGGILTLYLLREWERRLMNES